MIPVVEQPEPQGFNDKVRRPGTAFLQRCPHPTTRDYSKAAYWTEAAEEMYVAYQGICAYLCHWIPRPLARATIDHYKPKVRYPDLAYEWSNFRLCSDKMNNNKDHHEDVLDPFTLAPDSFAIDFATYFVEAGPGAHTQNQIAKVNATIDRLKLNNDDLLVQARCDVVGDYVSGGITMNHMDRRYPFIAEELRRQNLTQAIKTMHRTRSKK